MKYYQRFYGENGEPKEISAKKAKDVLSGWWKKEFLEKMFSDKASFRLYTPYSEIWSETDDFVVEPGFYGVAGDFVWTGRE